MNLFLGCSPFIAAVLFVAGCSSVCAQVCQPVAGTFETDVTAKERNKAGAKTLPPISDHQDGFAWPDTELGVLETPSGLAFFASDGGLHSENNKYGSITRTIGTLDDPLGNRSPIDVIIHPNPDRSVNPNYDSYTYLGGGRVYLVPQGQPGAGNLIDLYHAEINTDTSFYSLLGLALSTDGGIYWTDLGEIIRLNQPYEADLAGFDIGVPAFTISPDGTYFYVYFPDWIANGTTQPTSATILSVARAPIASVIAAAAGSPHQTAAFTKYYQGNWDQPGIGGLSTDLNPEAGYSGSPNVAYSPGLQRYVLIADDTVHITYSGSADGLTWTLPKLLLQDLNPQTGINYAVPLGMGKDPNLLGAEFFVYFTGVSAEGWPENTVERLSVSCKD